MVDPFVYADEGASMRWLQRCAKLAAPKLLKVRFRKDRP
jgi:hypothetical protein